MQQIAAIGVVGISAIAAMPFRANADSLAHVGSVLFNSDLQANKFIVLPSFDNQAGSLQLTNVLVEVSHTGSVDLAGDNDDKFQGVTMRGRMIRSWSLSGPGVGESGFEIVNTPDVSLLADDNDGGNNDVFDSTIPDGQNFGTLAYGPLTVGNANPPVALYENNGPGSVSFEVDVTLMINDLNFTPSPPDAWQLQVENPKLSVSVAVTYTYIPEPATLAFVAIGAMAIIQTRKRRSKP